MQSMQEANRTLLTYGRSKWKNSDGKGMLEFVIATKSMPLT